MSGRYLRQDSMVGVVVGVDHVRSLNRNKAPEARQALTGVQSASLNQSRIPGSSETHVCHDWSFPEMGGVHVNQQNKELETRQDLSYCLPDT